MNKGLAIVQTWKAESQSQLGGHAAIEIRLPKTPDNLELIKQHSEKNPSIPFFITSDVYLVRFSFTAGNFAMGEPFKLIENDSPADAQIALTLGEEKNDLQPASMLGQMRKIVDSVFEYDPHSNNSASTVLSILRAGREGKTFEPTSFKMLVSTFLPAVTPQMVFNIAMEIKNKPHAKNAINKIQPTLRKNQNVERQRIIIISLLAIAGFILGADSGLALVATRVFAPYGVGLLGLVAVAGTLGVTLALISGALGVNATKSVKTDTPKPTELTISGCPSYKAMDPLLSKSTKSTTNQLNPMEVNFQ